MKKVLIITYYWPPAGGPGVQRVLYFAKYLPQFGWEPIILTVENGEYPAIDHSLEKEIPENIKVYKTKTWEPFGFYKKLIGKKKDEKIDTYVLTSSKKGILSRISSWIRLNVFIPDARIGWYPYAVKKGLQIIKAEKPDLIFSSSPPHSLQLIAMKLSKKTGLKWVSDFRDPWRDFFILSDYKRFFLSDKFDKILYKLVTRNVNHIVTVSSGMVSKLNLDKDFSIIYNGFDFSLNPNPKSSNKFRIRYYGSISRTQVPKIFLEIFTILDSSILDLIDFKIYGYVDESIIRYIDEFKLQNIIKLESYISHSEVIQDMSESNLLLLLIPNVKGEGILTGKLFEYLGSKKRILAISNENKDLEEIINISNIGKIFSYNENISLFLQTEFKNWVDSNIIPVNNEYIESFSRENQTKKLAKVFDIITK